MEARVGFEPTNGGFAVRSSRAALRGAVGNQTENTAVGNTPFRSVRHVLAGACDEFPYSAIVAGQAVRLRSERLIRPLP